MRNTFNNLLKVKKLFTLIKFENFFSFSSKTSKIIINKKWCKKKKTKKNNNKLAVQSQFDFEFKSQSENSIKIFLFFYWTISDVNNAQIIRSKYFV